MRRSPELIPQRRYGAWERIVIGRMNTGKKNRIFLNKTFLKPENQNLKLGERSKNWISSSILPSVGSQVGSVFTYFFVLFFECVFFSFFSRVYFSIFHKHRFYVLFSLKLDRINPQTKIELEDKPHKRVWFEGISAFFNLKRNRMRYFSKTTYNIHMN